MTTSESQGQPAGGEGRVVMRVTLSIGGMSCSSCAAAVMNSIQSVKPKGAVLRCQVNALSAKGVVEMDSTKITPEDLVEAVEDTGRDAEIVNVELLSESQSTGGRAGSLQKKKNDDDNNNNGNANDKMILYQFSIEGMTCSNCVQTVHKTMANLDDAVDKDSVKVNLFPEGTLRLQAPQSKISKDDIIAAIESVGYGASLVSMVETTGNKAQDASKSSMMRISIITVDNGLPAVEKMLKSLPQVTDVSRARTKQKETFLSSKKYFGPLLSLWKKLSSRDALMCSRIPEADEEQQQNETDPMVGGSLRVTFQESAEMGIRDLVHRVEELVYDGTVTVRDAVGLQSTQETMESRRMAELRSFRNDFVFAALFTIPVAFISLLFAQLPNSKLNDYAVWNITKHELLAWILATPVQFISGARFYHETFFAFKTMNFGMGVLICLGSSAAYFYSVFAVLFNAIQSVAANRLAVSFETSSLLIMFVLLGKYLESRVKARTSSAISSLINLVPESVTFVGTWSDKENKEQSVAEERMPLSLLQRNDILLVRPGENIPTDGCVISGETTIDESMITGESAPVSKHVNDPLIGGTINLDGSIRMRVVSVGGNTTLAQIVNLVESAQANSAPIEEFADWASARFVPTVVLLSALTYIIWAALLNTSALDGVKESWPYKDQGLNGWTLPLIFAISTIVISCPCALGLATPTAIMVGSGVGARNGILIKTGNALDAANKLSAVIFDKTGTLTFGTPHVEEVLLLSDQCSYLLKTTKKNRRDRVSPSEKAQEMRSKTLDGVFFLAACAENLSEHPLAKGIVAKAKEFGIGEDLSHPLVQPDYFKSKAGSGIEAKVQGHSIQIGNLASLKESNIKLRSGTDDAVKFLESKGQTAAIVSVDGQTEAVIGLRDQARDEAKITVTVLRKVIGVKVFMLTGDNLQTAQIVAADIGIDPGNVIADVLPEDKANYVKRVREEQNGAVAMVGDGVNDSPALAEADIGIAIGAGSNIAIETAGLVLMNSKLTDVVSAVNLARAIYSRIRWNFLWALGYNTVAIPFAAGVLYPVLLYPIPPYVAGIAMILSSLTVLTSSLLLNRYRPPNYQKEYERNEDGNMDLSRIHMTTADGSTTIVECEGMRAGGPCSCQPESCSCDACYEHHPDKASAFNTGLEINRFYPGCASSWGNSCNCNENCNCAGSCCRK